MWWVEVDNMHEQTVNGNRVMETLRKNQKKMIPMKTLTEIKNIFDSLVEWT